MIKIISFLWLVLLILPLHAQDLNELQINPLLIDRQFQDIKNDHVLNDFFRKLEQLEHGDISQVTVVQIGDSHVQGPYFPQYIREGLQTRFGNAGRGFVFPYRVAQTNGAIDVNFKASGNWTAVRNVKSNGNENIGISGIYLETTDSDFIMELNLSDAIEKVTEIEVLSPNPEYFKLSTSSQKDLLKKVAVTKTYRVATGDYLGKIAVKFNTTVKEIQRVNNMKSTSLRAGQTLHIPTKASVKQSNEVVFTVLPTLKKGVYQIPSGVKQFYISAAQNRSKYILDGLLLNNGNSGINYHAIGVNGTKFADYNRFPRFFDQLASLNPDLIIISLGTNESFYDTYNNKKLKADMDQFNRNMIERGMTGNVLLTSPPPSMKNRKKINNTATAYAYEMGVFANLNSWAFYDLHSVSKTSDAMPDWYEARLTSSDRIHFLEKGYQLQAWLLVASLLKSYAAFKL